VTVWVAHRTDGRLPKDPKAAIVTNTLASMLVATLALPVIALAQPQATPDQLVVVDLTGETPRVASVPYSEALGAEAAPSDPIRACETEPERIVNLAGCLLDHSRRRWVSTRGREVVALVVHQRQADPNVRFIEESRRTRIAEDLLTLGKLAAKMVSRESEPPPPPLRCIARPYRLVERRAHLKVRVSHAEADGEKVDAETTLVTGPEEHWYLSADIPVRRIDELALDENGNATPKDTPQRFLVGLNFGLGDILSDGRGGLDGLRDNLVLKLQLAMSKRPFDRIGAGLALRGTYLKSFGLDFDVVSPFLGVLWSRNTDEVASAPDGERWTAGFQVGLCFNLDRALAWVGAQ
jgi:hypothetical protein